MKTFKRSLIFMTAFVMLFLLSGKQLRAAEVLEPVEISSPLEVEENIKQDVGMFAQHDALGTSPYRYNSYYYKVNVEERGYLMVRALTELNSSYGTTNIIVLWQNASMTAKLEGYGLIGRIVDKHGENYRCYYLDPGTYYLEMQAGRAMQTCYAYFMPSSNVLSVSVNSLQGKAELSVTTTVPQASIQWVENDSTNTNIWDEKFYANKTAENTIEVKENGTYYVRVSSTNNDWKDFPVDVVFDVTGITAPTPTPTVKPTLKPTATTTPDKKLSETVTVKKITSTVTVKKGKTVKATSKFKIYDKTKVSKVTYKTSNKKIASVSKSGKIKGVKKGTATITVTVTFKDKSTKKLTFKVKVK